jgi:hypothetical protein
MPTLIDQQRREQVSLQREADYLAYHEWLESLQRDEITDAAERVRAPQQTTIEFFLTADGLVNDLGQALRPIIEGGVAHAERMALTNPDWLVELERRRIELEEYDLMETLAVQGPEAGIMLTRWLIPDAVRSGQSTLPGYNRERLKMFNRYAAPTADGLIIGYQSLDGSHYGAVRAMDESLGYDLPEGMGSEDIARQRRMIPVRAESLDTLMDQQRDVYDQELTYLYGGEWYAGRPPISVKEVTRFIATQTDLVSEHMAIVHKIFNVTRDRDERMRLLEPHRYNFAAALDARLHGKPIESLAAAGEAARESGLDYDGDCPPGVSATSQLEQVGFKRGACPHCRSLVEYDPCNPECSACGATSKHGPTRKIGNQALKQTTTRRAKAANQRQSKTPIRRNRQANRPDKQFEASTALVRREQRLTIGGTKEVLVHLRTGQEVDV